MKKLCKDGSVNIDVTSRGDRHCFEIIHANGERLASKCMMARNVKEGEKILRKQYCK